MIRVLINDDHLVVREGLHLILETADDIEVVGEAIDGVERLQFAAFMIFAIGFAQHEPAMRDLLCASLECRIDVIHTAQHH